MKHKITQITSLLVALVLTLNVFGNDKPIAINVISNSKVIVSNSSGLVSIISSDQLKLEKSMHLMKSIKKASISSDGLTYWILGNDLSKNKTMLTSFDVKTWEKKSSVECSDAAFAPDGSKVAYRASAFAKELKIIDLVTREKTGGIKFSFTKTDASADFVSYSGDSKYIFVVERKYGKGNREILKYNGDGYSAKSLQIFMSSKGVSAGFGSGVISKGEEHILIGWSETIKITGDSCKVIDRGFDFCNTFYGVNSGDYFYILGSKGTRYTFEDLAKTSIEFDKVDGLFGTVSAATSLDDKTCIYVTDDFIIGKFNSDGFTKGEAMLSYKTDLVLAEFYKPETIKELKRKLKKGGYKVELPEKYSRSNNIVIETNLSLKEAKQIQTKLRKENSLKVNLKLSKNQ